MASVFSLGVGGGVGKLDLCTECFGHSKQSEIPLAFGSARNPSRIVLRMKRSQTCFALVLRNRLYNRPLSVPGCIHQGYIQSISHPSCLSTGFIVTEIPFSCRYIIFLEIFKAQKFGKGFFRVYFWSREFLGFFGFFYFYPNSIIPVT